MSEVVLEKKKLPAKRDTKESESSLDIDGAA
jgi:hypothetical protein